MSALNACPFYTKHFAMHKCDLSYTNLPCSTLCALALSWNSGADQLLNTTHEECLRDRYIYIGLLTSGAIFADFPPMPFVIQLWFIHARLAQVAALAPDVQVEAVEAPPGELPPLKLEALQVEAAEAPPGELPPLKLDAPQVEAVEAPPGELAPLKLEALGLLQETCLDCYRLMSSKRRSAGSQACAPQTVTWPGVLRDVCWDAMPLLASSQACASLFRIGFD